MPQVLAVSLKQNTVSSFPARSPTGSTSVSCPFFVFFLSSFGVCVLCSEGLSPTTSTFADFATCSNRKPAKTAAKMVPYTCPCRMIHGRTIP
ncbi:hypothetical protein Zmor_017806 [Zophobas morio]|uniref:Uncharacterized protein n=1 Tax=Zophobas morio TaxID=2755281 RepID=A0AA38I5T4_9CUCU|nr:hypothetical protein Zmor_017806 [Zophobas morio]